MTADTERPRMTKDEAEDFTAKLANFDSQLGPNQQKFLRLAISRMAQDRGEAPDVQGYDVWGTTGWYVAGYDYETGRYVYEDDYYDYNTGTEVSFYAE